MKRDANDILREEGPDALRDWVSSAEPFEPPPESVKPPTFALVPFADLKPGTEPPYLIDGLIPRVGLTVIWGPPKCGKSFWTFDAMMHVALDWLYRGRRVEPGPVCYCAFEGAEGFKKRAEGFRQRHHLGQHPPFYLIGARADLIKDHPALIADIRSQHVRPVAVVLDTLNRSLNGSEAKDEDMSKYVRAADAIREAFGCAVLIVHHCGVNDTRPRGHTSLTGAADAQLSVSRDGANNVVVTVEWMKDGEEGAVIASRLERVEIGTDLSSCVVVATEQAPVTIQTPKLSGAKRTLRDAIVEALDAYGTDTPVRGNTVRAVAVEHVREEFYRRYVTAQSDKDKAAENKSKAFRRSLLSPPPGFGLGTEDGAELIWRA